MSKRIHCCLKAFSYLVTLSLLLQLVNLSAFAQENTEIQESRQTEQYVSEEGSYERYLSLYTEYGKNDFEVEVANPIESNNISIEKGTVAFLDDSFATWEVNAENAGLYCIRVEYIPIIGLGKDMQLSVEINGKSPYDEASRIILEQVWKDDISDNGVFETDSKGNDILPDAIQSDDKVVYYLSDNEGYYSKPLMFQLEKGINKITFNSLGESFVLHKIYFNKPLEYISYSDYKKEKSYSNDEVKEYLDIIQAEYPSRKSDQSLYAAADKSDPLIEPSSDYANKRNVIGTNNWKNPGQYLEWEFEVPQTGFYKIGFKYKQNSNRGLYNLRKLYIDGEIPFAEAANIKFDYCDGYEISFAGNGKEEYLFYLEKGSHTIRLEVTLGDIADTLRTVDNAREQLSALIQRIMMVTSVNPDIYRDYYLEEQIPTLVSELKEISNILDGQIKKYEETVSGKGSNVATLEETSKELKRFADKTYLIPEKLSNLSSLISTLATWVNGQRQQLIELDYILIASPDAEMPKAQGSFFEKIFFEIKKTIHSYMSDYSVSEEQSEEIDVWITGGRDQRDILSELLGGAGLSFGVNLKLVVTSVTNAIMAGIGPDVVVNIAHTEPVNLGMRGALEPLNDYEGFDTLKTEYSEEAFVPYTLGENVYAIPGTEMFDVMYVRTDIFERLNLKVPQTWEEFFAVNRILQQNKMEAGVPENFYGALLYQSGGSYFNQEQTALNFDNDIAFSAFKKWVELYREYSFSLFKDDYNRFRTGEMPMMISNYTNYNKIYSAAPEIRNDWQMYLIPGTEKADGSIDRTNVGDVTGTASVILADSTNKDNAWEFLKWWSNSDTQAAFGNRLEYIMGVAGRYTPANIEAFKKLPWSADELNILLSQWEYIKQIPEVPGGYYVTRNIQNAFRACTTRNEDIKETFTYWTEETNKEISRKRKQYITN